MFLTNTHTTISEDGDPPPSSVITDATKKPSDQTPPTTVSATPTSGKRDSTPTPASQGERNETASESQTPSGSSQLGGVFSRLRKKVVEAAWQGAESKVLIE